MPAHKTKRVKRDHLVKALRDHAHKRARHLYEMQKRQITGGNPAPITIYRGGAGSLDYFQRPRAGDYQWLNLMRFGTPSSAFDGTTPKFTTSEDQKIIERAQRQAILDNATKYKPPAEEPIKPQQPIPEPARPQPFGAPARIMSSSEPIPDLHPEQFISIDVLRDPNKMTEAVQALIPYTTQCFMKLSSKWPANFNDRLYKNLMGNFVKQSYARTIVPSKAIRSSSFTSPVDKFYVDANRSVEVTPLTLYVLYLNRENPSLAVARENAALWDDVQFWKDVLVSIWMDAAIVTKIPILQCQQRAGVGAGMTTREEADFRRNAEYASKYRDCGGWWVLCSQVYIGQTAASDGLVALSDNIQKQNAPPQPEYPPDFIISGNMPRRVPRATLDNLAAQEALIKQAINVLSQSEEIAKIIQELYANDGRLDVNEITWLLETYQDFLIAKNAFPAGGYFTPTNEANEISQELLDADATEASTRVAQSIAWCVEQMAALTDDTSKRALRVVLDQLYRTQDSLRREGGRLTDKVKTQIYFAAAKLKEAAPQIGATIYNAAVEKSARKIGDLVEEMVRNPQQAQGYTGYLKKTISDMWYGVQNPPPRLPRTLKQMEGGIKYMNTSADISGGKFTPNINPKSPYLKPPKSLEEKIREGVEKRKVEEAAKAAHEKEAKTPERQQHDIIHETAGGKEENVLTGTDISARNQEKYSPFFSSVIYQAARVINFATDAFTFIYHRPDVVVVGAGGAASIQMLLTLLQYVIALQNANLE